MLVLHSVRPVSLDICHVERCVCFWPSWLSRLTLTSVRTCFGLPLSCLWSVFPVSRIFFIKVSIPYLLQFVFENYASILRELKWYEFINQCLVFIAKRHVCVTTVCRVSRVCNVAQSVLYVSIENWCPGGGSRGGVQGVRTPALLTRVPFLKVTVSINITGNA